MTRREPFIGITCDVHLPKKKKKRVRCELVCDYRYPEAVKQAGGYPVLIPIAYRSEIINRYLAGINGLVIVGGDDVDPRLYGEKRKKGTGAVFAPRLYFERKLYLEARRRKIPILGICYGMQLINVLEGGTLFQDIERDAKSKLDHRNKKHPLHKVRIHVKSRLGKIIGRTAISVHSDHHQAVCRVAPGFKPVAFASDGIIEAIEGDSKQTMAVQWHPERTLRNPDSRRLFHRFVRLCLAHPPRRRRVKRRRRHKKR